MNGNIKKNCPYLNLLELELTIGEQSLPSIDIERDISPYSQYSLVMAMVFWGI